MTKQQPLTPSVAAWDPATAGDPADDMRAAAARIRCGGGFPDQSAEMAAAKGGLDRLVAAVSAAQDFASVWVYGPVEGSMARAMLWYAVEILAGVPDVEDLLREVAADHARLFARRADAVRQAEGLLRGSEELSSQLDEQRVRQGVEAALDERAAALLMAVVGQVSGMSREARMERRLLAGAAPDVEAAEARLAAVREVADWLGALRGRGDDGKVYADLAELKLRTALGEHSPDGPCGCPACPVRAR